MMDCYNLLIIPVSLFLSHCRIYVCVVVVVLFFYAHDKQLFGHAGRVNYNVNHTISRQA